MTHSQPGSCSFSKPRHHMSRRCLFCAGYFRITYSHVLIVLLSSHRVGSGVCEASLKRPPTTPACLDCFSFTTGRRHLVISRFDLVFSTPFTFPWPQVLLLIRWQAGLCASISGGASADNGVSLAIISSSVSRHTLCVLEPLFYQPMRFSFVLAQSICSNHFLLARGSPAAFYPSTHRLNSSAQRPCTHCSCEKDRR